MSESTVDRHVYMFLNKMVYTAYNLTDPEANEVRIYTHIFTSNTDNSNTQILKLYSDPPAILQRTSEIILTR